MSRLRDMLYGEGYDEDHPRPREYPWQPRAGDTRENPDDGSSEVFRNGKWQANDEEAGE